MAELSTLRCGYAPGLNDGATPWQKLRGVSFSVLCSSRSSLCSSRLASSQNSAAGSLAPDQLMGLHGVGGGEGRGCGRLALSHPGRGRGRKVLGRQKRLALVTY